MPVADPSFPGQALIPLGPIQQLEPDVWQSPDDLVSFRILGPFRPGRISIRFNFRCEVPLLVRIVTDEEVPHVLQRFPPACRLVQKLFLRLEQPTAALRIEVIGSAPQFVLSDVNCQSLWAPRAMVDALFGKLMLLRRYGGSWPAFQRGMRLLLRGQMHTFFGKLYQSLGGPTFEAEDDFDAEEVYAAWRRQRLQRPLPRLNGENSGHAPLFSILVIVEQGEESLQDATLASLGRQVYYNWEMVAVRPLDGTMVDAEAANSALERAQGEYLLILNAGDEIADYACHSLALAVLADPTLDMLTTDEDEIDAVGRHGNAYFKPGFSPETLLSQPSLASCALFRTALVRELGGIRFECAALAVQDLALRMMARKARIQHLPDVLLHRRQEKCQAETWDIEALEIAIEDHLRETGRSGVVERTMQAPGYRVRFQVYGVPMVSILIPTAYAHQGDRKATALVAGCLRSIRMVSTWPHYEIILLTSEPPPAEVAVEILLHQHRVKIVEVPQPFNFARAINMGAAQAEGSQLLLLNDDTEVITPDWLQSMLEYAQQPDIGAVGARLLFPHGRVQHTGLHLLDGKPMHAFYGYPADHAGYHNSMNTPRNYLAVTGACLMTRRELFQQLGGLDMRLAMDCSDIDYCLRLIEIRRRVVCTPYAQLLHYEAVTRRGLDLRSYTAFKKRWANKLHNDPYYNPNFGRVDANYKSLRMIY